MYHQTRSCLSTGDSSEVLRHHDRHGQAAGGGQPHLRHRQGRPVPEGGQRPAPSHGTVAGFPLATTMTQEAKVLTLLAQPAKIAALSPGETVSVSHLQFY